MSHELTPEPYTRLLTLDCAKPTALMVDWRAAFGLRDEVLRTTKLHKIELFSIAYDGHPLREAMDYTLSEEQNRFTIRFLDDTQRAIRFNLIPGHLAGVDSVMTITPAPLDLFKAFSVTIRFYLEPEVSSDN